MPDYITGNLAGYEFRKRSIDVRDRGLWAGVEIDTTHISARAVCEKLMTLGVLTKDTHENVIRFAPPLIIEEAEVHFAIKQFVKALESF